MRDSVIGLIIIALAAAVIIWKAGPARAQSVGTIDAASLATRMEAGAPLYLIDVRTPAEIAEGMITGAISIPLDDLGDRLGDIRREAGRRPGATIVLVCRSGVRATKAARILDANAIGPAVVLSGGMIAWTAAGLKSTPPTR